MKFEFIKRCPYCGSIWVAWNWCHWNLEDLVRLNPHLTREEIKNSQWGHECWNCEGVNETENEVTNGIPHWLLLLKERICLYFSRGKA